MYPAIFLDRDGVIIENRANYVRDWSQVSIFPNAIKALTSLTVKKYKIVVATNQSAVGRNLISLKTVQEINDKLVDAIKQTGGKIDATYICPHAPDEQCICRKPQPGLLLQAARELSLDLNTSWMIGDAWSDLLAGQAAGTQGSIMVKTGRGAKQLLLSQPENLKNYFIFNDLFEAVNAIFQLDNRSYARKSD